MFARVVFVAFACVFTAGLVAGPRTAYAGGSGSAAKGSPVKGTQYGEALILTKTTKVSEIQAAPDEFQGKRVRVEGLITGVCSKRGCWMEIAGDKEFTTLRFKVPDGKIVFPMSARGKYAVAEGTVKKIVLTMEQTKKYLEHQAKEQKKTFDPASVKEPLTFLMLHGLGAVVRDAR